MEAWRMSEAVEDPRHENRLTPNAPVSFEELASIGVYAHHYDPVTMLIPAADGGTDVDRTMALLGYAVRDEVCCSPDTLTDYEAKIRSFFIEHAHEDDEVRLVKSGTGYFDVRDANDEWVRVRVTPGDLLILPAGIYHRFTLDTGNYLHAIRLFSTAPRWVPLNRPCEDVAARKTYIATFIDTDPPHASALKEIPSLPTTVIRDPSTFTDTMRRLTKAMRLGDVTVVYFRGMPWPGTSQSWCPDCVAAEPILLEGMTQLKRTVSHGVLRYVEVLVHRASYRGRPEYTLRTHPFAGLRAIPTVIGLKCVRDADAHDGVEELCRFEEELPADWASILERPCGSAEIVS